METKSVSHSSGRLGIRKILLVGENEKDAITELVLLQHAMKLIAGSFKAMLVIGIYNENKALSILEVVSPKGADLVLSSHVPNCEADILVINSFNVES